jgi:hypothetical protein
LIDGFIDSDPIYPTKKFELGVVLVHPFKNFQEYKLCNISSIFRISKYPVSCIKNRPLVFLDQLAQGLPVSLSASTDEFVIPVVMHNYLVTQEKLVK